MTAVDNITSLRQRREAIVNQHAEAENRHDVEATIATFHRPRYEVNGDPSDGEEAVRELLQGFMHGLPDLHIDPVKLRHADDAVIIEGLITGTQDGEWAGIPPTGRPRGADRPYWRALPDTETRPAPRLRLRQCSRRRAMR